mgnify:CR=1 FL=1
MRYFPPERTQAQLDAAVVFPLSTHWAVLEGLRALANAMQSRAKDSQRRDRLLAFAATLEAMHDEFGDWDYSDGGLDASKL